MISIDSIEASRSIKSFTTDFVRATNELYDWIVFLISDSFLLLSLIP